MHGLEFRTPLALSPVHEPQPRHRERDEHGSEAALHDGAQASAVSGPDIAHHRHKDHPPTPTCTFLNTVAARGSSWFSTNCTCSPTATTASTASTQAFDAHTTIAIRTDLSWKDISAVKCAATPGALLASSRSYSRLLYV